jgi:hypothetical protein
MVDKLIDEGIEIIDELLAEIITEQIIQRAKAIYEKAHKK